VNTQLVFLHGKESSGQGFKANLLRSLFPHILTPDFDGSLEERMAQLAPILAYERDWVIIGSDLPPVFGPAQCADPHGSSMGGLMAALFTHQHQEQVQRLILLAPALTWPEFADTPLSPVAVPTTIYHGLRDTVVPLEPVRALAERAFTNLIFHAVDDDHRLRETVQTIDWPHLVMA